LYAAFGVFYLSVPVIARRVGRAIEPAWGGGAVLISSLLLLLFVASGPQSSDSLWGLALLLAMLNAGVFVESAAVRLPVLSIAGGIVSWFVLGVWWSTAATTVGVLPSLLMVAMLALLMLGGHAWAHTAASGTGAATLTGPAGFWQGAYLGLVGHL